MYILYDRALHKSVIHYNYIEIIIQKKCLYILMIKI